MRYVSVSEYAATCGITPQRVRQMITEGKLPGEMVGGRWMIPADAIPEEATRKRPREDLGGCRILTLFSHAGGVGKTTLTRDLGYRLADLGYRTLLIDADPQANLSTWLGIEDVDDSRTLARLIAEGKMPEPVRNLFGKPLDLIPANLNLVVRDLEISRKPGGDMMLRRQMAESAQDYDVILVDSPPYVSQLTTMAGLAGEGFIVPIETSAKGLESLQGLIALAATFASAVGKQTHEWIKLLVPTKYDPRTQVDKLVTKTIERMKTRGYAVSEPTGYRPGPHKLACMEGKPIPALRPYSKATMEIDAVVSMLIGILKENKEARA